MPTINVPAGDIASHGNTLAANTETTVQFPAYIGTVEILSDGAAPLYVTTDGTTPTVAGGNTHLIPAGGASTIELPSTYGQPTKVRLISAGTPTVSVARA